MFVLLALLSVSVAGDINLAVSGKSNYSIVVPEDAIPAEKRAASELQLYLREMTGATLPIRAKRSGPSILLGEATGLAIKGFGEDEFVIRGQGKDLLLAGGRPRGVMYAAYSLLDSLGCRWYCKDVTVIPKRPTLTVSPLERREAPAFEYREPFFTEALDKEWAAHNRCNGSFQNLDESVGRGVGYFPFVHSFYSILPPDKYFATHPEYYSELNGKRTADGGQLCVTNPEVLRLTIEMVREWIRAHPEAKIISVSQNDWYGYCTCAECRKVIEEEGAPSGPVLRFVNAVGDAIAKEFPDKLIDTLAYQWTEDPPSKVKPHANVRVRMAPIANCFGHPIDGCERNAKPLANLQAWANVTSNLYIWHYNTNFAHYLAPFPDFDELAGSTRAYKRLGVKGIFFEGAYGPGGGAEFSEMRSWVMARLLWDPSRDVWALVDEYLGAVYGKAARPIRKYMALLAYVVKAEKMHFGIYDDPLHLRYLRRDIVDRAEKWFEEAETVVTGAELARVQKVRLPIDYTRWRQATDDADRLKYGKRLAEGIRRFGIGEIREGGSAEQFLQSLGL